MNTVNNPAPHTMRATWPGTDVVIELVQDKDGDVGLRFPQCSYPATYFLDHDQDADLIRRLGFYLPDDSVPAEEYKLLRCHGESDFDWYREVNPIPEGYEACDLEGATKVLIGETWCDVERDAGGAWIMVPPNKTYHTHGFRGLGLLAIRPIPEPEPMRGEAKVCENRKHEDSGLVHMPVELIGKRVRWEVIE